MYNKDVFEEIYKCRELILKVIENEFITSNTKRFNLNDCRFPSYSPDGVVMETTVTSIYLKDNDVWVDFHDEFTGEHSFPLNDCFTVDEMISIMSEI